MTRYVWFLAYNLLMDVGGMFWTKTFGDDDNEDDGDDDDVEVA